MKRERNNQRCCTLRMAAAGLALTAALSVIFPGSPGFAGILSGRAGNAGMASAADSSSGPAGVGTAREELSGAGASWLAASVQELVDGIAERRAGHGEEVATLYTDGLAQLREYQLIENLVLTLCKERHATV